MKGSKFLEFMQQKHNDAQNVKKVTSTTDNLKHTKEQAPKPKKQKQIKRWSRPIASHNYGNRWQYQYIGPIVPKNDTEKYNNNIEDNYELFSR